MKELVLNIASDGSIQSLYHDFLSNIDGNKTIERASNVEFDTCLQKWIVTIETGQYKGCCLINTFTERTKAIDAEIEFFNSTMFH